MLKADRGKISPYRGLVTWFRNLTGNGFPEEILALEIYQKADAVRFTNIICLIGIASSLLLLMASAISMMRTDIFFHTGMLFGFIGIASLLQKTRNIILTNILIPCLLFFSIAGGFFFGVIASEGLVFFLSLPLIIFHLYGTRWGLVFLLVFQVLFCTAAAAGLIKSVLLLKASVVVQALVINYFVLSFFVFLHEKREESFITILKKRTFTDELTGLANRARLVEDIKTCRLPVLIIVNIDDFKEINDSFGYAIGDEVLVFLADKLKDVIPVEGTIIYRVGADEFAILMELEINGSQDCIKEMVNLIRHYVYSKKFTSGSYEILLRVTIGAASAKDVGRENLFTHADIALKSAKHANKPYEIFLLKEVMATKKLFSNNIIIAKILSEAIDMNRVLSYYQPIYSNALGKIVKYECLVRIKDAHDTIYQPADFIELATRTRLGIFLTRSVFQQAFEQFKAESFSFSLNLSFQDIENIHTRNFIFKKIESAPHLRGRIIFEILESEGIKNYETVSEFIRKAKSLGCKIAIDDFGAGYSNFVHIQKLDIDFIKIDGSLIKDIDKDVHSKVLVETIVTFAKKMNIETVAEFVHTEAIFKKVIELGIDYSQGYYIGKPSPALIENAVFIGEENV